MQNAVKVLFVSTYPPRACGIGTFTRDLTSSISEAAPYIIPHIAAVDINDDNIEYGEEVICRISNTEKHCFRKFAHRANSSDYDVICVQHEYGIFPGDWGKELLHFYDECNKPIVTTLHTIIPRCEGLPRRIISNIVNKSAATVIMAEIGVDILESDYEIGTEKLRVIPHGVPEVPRMGEFAAKEKLGLTDRDVIASFGLLSRGKGIEYAIAAMPDVIKARPNAIYCILGQTHPIVKKHEGEAYREHLQQLVRNLGLSEHVWFVNKFLPDKELSVYLEATDVYATPYLGADQITSGAMARAIFFGKAIVSTPFLYAVELLANGRGRLVPFKDSAALAAELIEVLSDSKLRASMEASALSFGRAMAWNTVARKYAKTFKQVSARHKEKTHKPEKELAYAGNGTIGYPGSE